MPKPKSLSLLVGLIALIESLAQYAFAHGMSDSDKQAIIEGGNLLYLKIGATHMLAGYDHLMFVFGIVFFLTSLRDILKYVTAFTLGHSITLIYATYNGIQLNYFLIDAVIALSVCYIAFANIDGFRKYLNVAPPNMLLMIVGLGLIHGFGLSTRLQELPLDEANLLLNIVSFNVGIELGQVSALALMLLIIAGWRKYHSFQTFSLLANYGLIAAGLMLFLMQAHGYSHSSDSEVLADTTQATPWQDTISIIVPPRSGKEYKFFLEKDATLHYSWATGSGEQLFFDFHGEPKGDTTGYFKSFKQHTDNWAEGSLKAVFAGTHGWYWKNTTNAPITVSLRAKGEYQRLDLTQAQANTAVGGSVTDPMPDLQLNESTAKENAKNVVVDLVKKGKIDSSWDSIPASNAEEKNFGGRMEWVVTFENANIVDSDKRTLFIFLSPSGEYLAANYTGK